MNRLPDAAAFIRQKGLLHGGERVLVACSGGVDSMALLHYLATFGAAFSIEVGAVHVDHCLRGEESAKDGEAVGLLAERLGVPCYRTAVRVPDLVAATGGNVQDICRTGRYGKFAEVMADGRYQVLATAHHAEDQLETVLMQLAKGQRPKGMPVERELGDGRLIRPFLPLGKAGIYQYAKEHALPYREDPSNGKDQYTRNRYRHYVLPALLAEEPRAAQQAVVMAETQRAEDDLLDKLAEEQADRLLQPDENGRLTIVSGKFSAMHPALQKRVVPLVLKYLYNGETVPAVYNASLVNQVIHQLNETDGSALVHLPQGWLLQRTYSKSTFVREVAEGHSSQSVPFPENRWVRYGSSRFLWCRAAAADPADLAGVSEWRYFQSAEGGLPAVIRTRLPGDRIRLAGMDTPKKLSRLFIDEKVEQPKRDGLPVIVSEDGGICAVPGVRYGAGFTTQRPDGEAYILMTDRSDGRHPPAAR